MKRLKKKKLVEALITLREANELMVAGGIAQEQLLAILAQCQGTAVALGTVLENYGEAGTQLLPMLEEYCETLYQQSQCLNDKDGQKELCHDAVTILDALEEKMEQELPQDKKVAVFLPYKASMWDSLESVWKAADEDENCEAYVVPIPYYDRGFGEDFGEMHYEGNEYPADVTVYDWREFSLADMQPDMVFIHNPYDEYNYVTSVHPAFYSSELKKHTKKLVYIPYFNTGGAIADSFESMVAYYHCDYIVAQTEEQKEYFTEDIRYKVLALGSPKYDKIINYQIKKEDLSESWKAKITGKVIFYNTSISGVLQHGEQAIQKMLYVFNTFKDLDVALLWRPHPLLKSTIQSMRPDLLGQYEKAEEAFQQVKNGILDTTAEATRSVKLSDAYIGEETSSMVHQFGVQGKPIFLTNMNVIQNWDSEKENVKIFDCVYEEGFYWALCGDWNGLLKIDQLGCVIKIYEIPGEKRDNPRLYNSVVCFESKLYLIPYTGRAIAVFDMNTEEFVKISLSTPRRTNFSKAFLYKGNIYMVPTYYKGIVQLDCATGKLTCYDKVVKAVRELYGNSEDVFSFNGSVIEDNKLLIAVAFGECVVEMNLDTKEYKVQKIGTGNEGYWCMTGACGRYILGSNMGRRLIYWNRERKEVKEITAYPKGWQGETNCFYTMEKMDNEVLVFPKFSNQILRIPMDDLQMSVFKTDENHTPEERKNGYYSWPCNYLMARKLSDDSILVQSAYSYGLTIVKTSGETKHLPVHVPEKNFPYGYEDLFCRRSKNLPWVMRENDKFSLTSFVQYVSSNKHDAARQIQEYGVVAENLDGSCGEKIYKAIVDEL